MEIYKTRPGVVLASICGEYLLISGKGARDICPYATQINETSADLWRCLERGATFEQLFEALSEAYEIEDPDAAKEGIRSFLDQMQETGYLKGKEKEETNE